MEIQLSLKDYLNNNILITDGAFGTYYGTLYDTQELPELANISNPGRVSNIHSQYINAGAKLIRTNTYAANTYSLKTDITGVEKYIRAACDIAAGFKNVYVAGDIGPIECDNINLKDMVSEEYIAISKIFIEYKLPVIVFETFSQLEDIIPAIEYIKANSDTFVIVQFAVNQFGYSNAGLSAKRLFADATYCSGIDAVGLNCGVGPGHMQQIIGKLIGACQKPVTALPNAGYPQNISNRMIFASDNKEYFAAKTGELADMGVSIIGGCCGTTPEYIEKLNTKLLNCKKKYNTSENTETLSQPKVTDNSFYKNAKPGGKLIAVELAPPVDSNDEKLMEAAHILHKSGVDVVTFPDSPSGRTRADSILMAEKVFKETGLCVMPHLCCRDKNAIAMRSQLLGAHINGIDNFLVITGDPVPSMARQTVKSVFNFDSVGLMNIIKDMNTDQFITAPICYGGAVSQNRHNIDIELRRMEKKMKAGASFFMTQPVFDKNGADKLKYLKEKTGARILCGIMPLVSYKNAVFMKNEMTGIEVSDEITKRYKDCLTKEQGEAVGVAIAKEVIKHTRDFVDGYYFSFPFNRVYLLDRILH